METEARWAGRFDPDWCPHPEHWHSADSEATEIEVSGLVGSFVRALQPELVVETGSYTGQTTLAMGAALADNGHGHLFSAEASPGLAQAAAHVVRDLPVSVVNLEAETWLEIWQAPGPVGFAWIDSGNHMTRAREVAVMLRRGLFSPGAIIGIHDTGAYFNMKAEHYPVDTAWRPLEADGSIKMITLRTPRGVSFAQVVA